MREGDWVCGSCQNHNYASRAACNKCNMPKGPQQGHAAPPAAPGAQRAGDWICSSCQNHNYANRLACNRCQMPKTPQGVQPGWNMAYGKGASFPAQRQTPYAAPQAAAPAGGKQGDWTCPGCQNHNYHHRIQCNRCGGPRAGQTYMPPMPPPMQAQQMMMKMLGAATGRPGDWQCRACQNLNYASREQCNKCGIAKDVFIAPTGMREGDWICSSCQNHNYASKTACNKCAGPKDSANYTHAGGKGGGGKGKLREGDWMCPSCNNHNYASKQVCNRCSEKKPEALG